MSTIGEVVFVLHVLVLVLHLYTQPQVKITHHAHWTPVQVFFFFGRGSFFSLVPRHFTPALRGFLLYGDAPRPHRLASTVENTNACC